jgi:hypothetical protein
MGAAVPYEELSDVSDRYISLIEYIVSFSEELLSLSVVYAFNLQNLLPYFRQTFLLS